MENLIKNTHPRSHETSRWSDAHKSCNDGFAGTNDCELLAFEGIMIHSPPDNSLSKYQSTSAYCTASVQRCLVHEYTYHRGCNVGVPNGHHCTHAGVDGGAAIEAKPAEPDQDCTKEDNRNVMRFVDVLLLMLTTVAEDESVRKAS